MRELKRERSPRCNSRGKGCTRIYRVVGARVTLDLVAGAFHPGATAEQIAQKYNALQLQDLYQVIGYYRKRANELAEYFDSRASEEQDLPLR